MKAIAKTDCLVNGMFYQIGDEIKIESKEQLVKLNEKGFIEPLTPKEIQEFKIDNEKKEA
jgi:hypothetical protein